MAPGKIQQAIGVVKDHTSIGLAMVGGNNTASDLEIAIIRATCHNKSQPQERHVRRIINLTTFSKPLVSACVGKIGKRLNKTKNWVVALKTLILVHRLLNDGDATYQEEIFSTTRRGARFLNMSGFRDASNKSNSWDFSAFIRTYAQYLDEQLEFRMEEGTRRNIGHEDDGGASRAAATATAVHEMKNANVFGRVQRLKQLLDRFLACRPTGVAKCNKVVDAALYQIVKESFNICYKMMEVIGTLVERFMKFEVRDMVRVHEIFCHVSKQYDEIDALYDWCKNVGIMSCSEFPRIDKIPKTKLDTMDDFINRKSELLRNRKGRSNGTTSRPEEEEELEEEERVIEALPPGDIKQAENEIKKTQDVGDLLTFEDDPPTTQEQGHKMALVSFDGASPATIASESTMTSWVAFKDDSSGATQWEDFKDSSDDWEAKLVQSPSNSVNQRTTLPRSFDPFMLGGMYQNGLLSNSGSVAYGSPGNGRANNFLPSNTNPFTASPVIAPPADHGRANSFMPNTDPFATFSVIAPPADHGRTNSYPSNTHPFTTSTVVPPMVYMQMSEIQKQQRLLPDSQLYWYQQQQQYAKDGIPGWIGIGNVHQQYPYQYVAEGYTQAW